MFRTPLVLPAGLRAILCMLGKVFAILQIEEPKVLSPVIEKSRSLASAWLLISAWPTFSELHIALPFAVV